MANKKPIQSKFLALLCTISLAGAGSLISAAPSFADVPATPTVLTFDANDSIGLDAVGANASDSAGSFEGLVTSVVEAEVNGVTSDVLQMEKSGQPWAGLVLVHFTDRKVGAVVEFDMYSPESAATTAWIKFEDVNGGNATEMGFEASAGWAHYALDMTNSSAWNAGVEYANIVLFPDYNGDGTSDVDRTGQLYLLDNVQINGGLLPTPTLLTFEDDDAIGAGAAGTNSGDDVTGSFEGMVTAIADTSNGGGTGKVLQMPKGGQPWAGVVITHFTDRKIGSAVSFDLYSPESASATGWIKFEDVNGANATEVGFEVAPGWNRYTIDMTTSSNWNSDVEYANFVFFPDYNGDGTSDIDRTGQVYLLDNLSLNGAEMPALVSLPVKTKNPTITGTVKVGKILTANGFVATWEGDPTLSYKWFACTAKGTNNPSVKPANCSAISGATAKKLTLKKAQKGKFIRVRVTATNDAGSVSVFSDSTKVKVS